MSTIKHDSQNSLSDQASDDMSALFEVEDSDFEYDEEYEVISAVPVERSDDEIVTVIGAAVPEGVSSGFQPTSYVPVSTDEMLPSEDPDDIAGELHDGASPFRGMQTIIFLVLLLGFILIILYVLNYWGIIDVPFL